MLCRHIAELIFYMEELRAHVRKYGPVMQRYYVQYLSGFDAVVLNELVQVRIHFRIWFRFPVIVGICSWIQDKSEMICLLTGVLSCLHVTEPVCVSRGWIYNHVFICQHNDFSQCQTRWIFTSCKKYKLRTPACETCVVCSQGPVCSGLVFMWRVNCYAFVFQWRMERCLTSEEWDWTGSDCRCAKTFLLEEGTRFSKEMSVSAVRDGV